MRSVLRHVALADVLDSKEGLSVMVVTDHGRPGVGWPAARQIVEAVAAHANLVAVIEWACLDTLAVDIEPGPAVGEYAMPVRRTEHERMPAGH